MYYTSGKASVAAWFGLFLIFLGGTALAQTKTIEEIVAWVNNEVILKSEYEARKEALRAQLAQPEPNGPGLKGPQLEQAFDEQSKRVLQGLIDETLILQQARDLGLSADNEIIKTLDRLRQERKLESLEALEKEVLAQGLSMEELRQNIRVSYLTEQVMQREVYGRVIVTTEEVRKYYDSHIKDFDRPAGIRVREIIFLTENRGPEQIENQRRKAEEALAAVKKGDDFAETAAKVSESQTAQDGGDLGFFAKGELAPALEAITDKLEKGQVSDIIPVQGAFMILKVDDKHSGGVLPFDLAQKEIFNILWRQGVPAKQREYLSKLRTDGFVRTADGYVDTGASPDKSVAKD
jgi:peptidyl-prolyl cis-trans isomerase SurA